MSPSPPTLERAAGSFALLTMLILLALTIGTPAGAGAEEVRYALGGLERRLFVARYQVRLPKEHDIATFLRQQRQDLAE